ncbi:hypothetical protein H4R35_005928 [Dimargaris xerosporica]|nr:hypothetical protein H4R35_005928 [Dimargaris xerosporica]
MQAGLVNRRFKQAVDSTVAPALKEAVTHYPYDPTISKEQLEAWRALHATDPNQATVLLQRYNHQQMAYRDANGLPLTMLHPVQPPSVQEQVQLMSKMELDMVNFIVLYNTYLRGVIEADNREAHLAAFQQYYPDAFPDAYLPPHDYLSEKTKVQMLVLASIHNYQPITAIRFGYPNLSSQGYAIHVPAYVEKNGDMKPLHEIMPHHFLYAIWTSVITDNQDRTRYFLNDVMAYQTIPSIIALYISYGQLEEADRFIRRMMRNDLLSKFRRDAPDPGYTYHEFAVFAALYIQHPEAAGFFGQVCEKPDCKVERLYYCPVSGTEHQRIQTVLDGLTDTTSISPVGEEECRRFQLQLQRVANFWHKEINLAAPIH